MGGRRLPGQREFDRRRHFRAAVGRQAGDVAARDTEIAGIGRDAGGIKRPGHGVELDDVETITARKTVERQRQSATSLLQGGAVHGTGGVDHENELSGQRRRGDGGLVRGQHHQQHVRRALGRIRKQHGARASVGRGFPGQFQVAVHRHDTVGKPDLVAPTEVGDVDDMVAAGDELERHAGIDIGGKAELVVAGRGKHGRRYLRGIGHGRGIRRPAGTFAADRIEWHSRYVAGRHRRRHPQAEDVLVVSERFLVFDLYRDRLPGCDIGDRRRKQVGALLLDETRFPARRFRRFVFFYCPRFLADLAFDEAFADIKPQVVDSRLVGQRIHVYALDPLLAVIAKLLAHAHPRNRPADARVDGCIEARSDTITVRHAQQQAAGGDLVGRRGAGGTHEDREAHAQQGGPAPLRAPPQYPGQALRVRRPGSRMPAGIPGAGRIGGTMSRAYSSPLLHELAPSHDPAITPWHWETGRATAWQSTGGMWQIVAFTSS